MRKVDIGTNLINIHQMHQEMKESLFRVVPVDDSSDIVIVVGLNLDTASLDITVSDMSLNGAPIHDVSLMTDIQLQKLLDVRRAVNAWTTGNADLSIYKSDSLIRAFRAAVYTAID